MYSPAVIALALATAAITASSAPLSARGPVPDDSGALDTGLIKDAVNIGSDVINGISQVKSAVDANKQQRRYDTEELLARASSTADKVGLAGDIVDIGNGIVQGAEGIKNLFTGKREEPTVDDSGALDIGKIISGILKREDIESTVAREVRIPGLKKIGPAPRDDSNASGALNFGKIISGILKREDASGALNVGKIISGILKRDHAVEERRDWLCPNACEWEEELTVMLRAVAAPLPSTRLPEKCYRAP
ncbi:hypothetical protein EIP91_003799 [Steccherinum ochraceum]|uniref:Uncharacterized protein n=1 Tax=Steccherinum ochraceum TaxID=92696 RepID=A0A4R0RG98_9APHY|nr:hypothetical protein EIP91_003799 [Steccherinum ochraceum]